MLEVDFHSHSLFSGCGLHTIIEMLTYAKTVGLKALAITDHGTAQTYISAALFSTGLLTRLTEYASLKVRKAMSSMTKALSIFP